MMLPYFLTDLMRRVTDTVWILSITEALVRVAIFLAYLILISRMKDIQRTFMYHGAEHKCINCIEHGMELNVENVLKSSRLHKRCGTSFLFFVIIVSAILLMFVQMDSRILRIVVRLLLVPVIAGVSFEIIRLAGRSENPFVNALSKPGLALQRLTTREPDAAQAEVAIAAVEAVFDWRAYLRENFGYTDTGYPAIRRPQAPPGRLDRPGQSPCSLREWLKFGTEYLQDREVADAGTDACFC